MNNIVHKQGLCNLLNNGTGAIPSLFVERVLLLRSWRPLIIVHTYGLVVINVDFIKLCLCISGI